MEEKGSLKNIKQKLYIRLLIIIILIFLVMITSFRTGRKFYILKNTFLEKTTGEVKNGLAQWEFNARIIKKDRSDIDEINSKNKNHIRSNDYNSN